MWLHFNKFDEYTGYTLPVWVFVPAFIIAVVMIFIFWPITAIAMSLYCFNEGKKVLGWAFLITIPLWIMRCFGGWGL